MKKKKKNHKALIGVLGTIMVVFLLYFSLKLDRKTNMLEDSLKTITTTISKTVISPLKGYNEDKDINQSESYIIQKNINTSLEREIKELKEVLQLNKTFTEYEAINATILSRNKSYWFNTIIIDKGKKDGLKQNMAVVTKNGLVGKISKVYRSSSEIKLITADDLNYKISVLISNNIQDTYGTLSGYLKDEQLLKITGLDKNSEIKEGDKVVTSGYGGVFPRGIYIGTVKKVESEKYNLSKIAYIKIDQDFNNIHYVTVLKDKK